MKNIFLFKFKICRVFAWRTFHHPSGNHNYEYRINDLTGERKAIRKHNAGYQPLDVDWIDGLVDRDEIKPNPRIVG